MARPFDATSLQLAVTQALANADIPAGHANAFTLYATTDRGVKAVISRRVNDVWEIDGIFAAEPGTGIAAGVFVKATW
jgi:hypothetical protein